MDYGHYQPQHAQHGHAPNPQQMHAPHAQVSPVLTQPHGFPTNQPQMGYPQGYPVQAMHNPYMNSSHAAAMATAAATGSYQGYGPMAGTLNHDPNASPRGPPMQQNKAEQRQNPRSPSQVQINAQSSMGMPPVSMAQTIPSRRMSSVSSPMAAPPSAMTSIGRSTGTAQVSRQSAPQQSTEATSGNDETPLYVNAKQFHRILKRRMARQTLEEALRLTAKGRKPYLHESRHKHAMRRPRGPGGRFLTAEEVAAMDLAEEQKTNGDAKSPDDNQIGSKRKSDYQSTNESKRAKGGDLTNDVDEDEDDDAGDD